MASRGDLPSLAFGIQGEVDHHNGVFLDDTDEQNDTDDADDARSFPEIIRASRAPTPAEGSVERIVTGWI